MAIIKQVSRRGRPSKYERDRSRVEELAEQGLGVTAIFKTIENDAMKAGRVEYPSVRTIRRLLENHTSREPGKQAQYREFNWPDSMEESDVPWEGSPAVLELIQDSLPERPSVGEVNWYWRVHLAAPDLTVRNKRFAARWLLEKERREDETTMAMGRAVETYLASKPWTWPPRLSDDEKRELTVVRFGDLSFDDRLRELLLANQIDAEWVLHTDSPFPVEHLDMFLDLVVVELGLLPEDDWEYPDWVEEDRDYVLQRLGLLQQGDETNGDGIEDSDER